MNSHTKPSKVHSYINSTYLDIILIPGDDWKGVSSYFTEETYRVMNNHRCICHLILISNFRRNCKKAQHYDLSLPIPVVFPFLLSIPVKDHYKSKFSKPFSFPSQHFHLSLHSGHISLSVFFSLPKTVFCWSITDSQGNSPKYKHHQHFKRIILKLI